MGVLPRTLLVSYTCIPVFSQCLIIPFHFSIPSSLCIIYTSARLINSDRRGRLMIPSSPVDPSLILTLTLTFTATTRFGRYIANLPFANVRTYTHNHPVSPFPFDVTFTFLSLPTAFLCFPGSFMMSCHVVYHLTNPLVFPDLLHSPLFSMFPCFHIMFQSWS